MNTNKQDTIQNVTLHIHLSHETVNQITPVCVTHNVRSAAKCT